MPDSSDQCALDANGKLKPAESINFYFNKDDAAPMAGPDATTCKSCDALGITFAMFKGYHTDITLKAVLAERILVVACRNFLMLKSMMNTVNWLNPRSPVPATTRGEKGRKRLLVWVFYDLCSFKTSPRPSGQTASSGEASDDNNFSVGSGSDTKTDPDMSEPDVTNKEVST